MPARPLASRVLAFTGTAGSAEKTRWTAAAAFSRSSWVRLSDVNTVECGARTSPLATTPEEPSYRCEYRVLLDGGAERWIGEKATVSRGPCGEIVRIAGAIVDISDLKRTEAALDSVESRFARSPLGISITSAGMPEAVNDFSNTLAQRRRTGGTVTTIARLFSRVSPRYSPAPASSPFSTIAS